jgi:tetratricopeptide (TPR) repeat protein
VRLYFQAFGEARDAFLKAKDQLEQQKALPRWIADATYWLGATTYFGGDSVKARPLAIEAIRLDPYLADAYVLLGWIDADKKQWKTAVKWWQKVTTLDPENVEAWFNLGEAALLARQPKLARIALEQYLKKAPSGDLSGEARTMLKGIK